MGLFKFLGKILFGIIGLLLPKVKKRKPESARDLEDPTAEAGRPIPVVFGTITVKGVNVLHFGDKSLRTYKVKV